MGEPWSCVVCTLLNPVTSRQCSACLTFKSKQKNRGNGRQARRDGKTAREASRKQKHVPSKQRQEFEEDWQCGICTFVNEVRAPTFDGRLQCVMCGSPRAANILVSHQAASPPSMVEPTQPLEAKPLWSAIASLKTESAPEKSVQNSPTVTNTSEVDSIAWPSLNERTTDDHTEPFHEDKGKQLQDERRSNLSDVAPDSGFTFNILPNEVLDNIFGFLSFVNLCKIGQVCKRFQSIVRNVWSHTRVEDLLNKIKTVLATPEKVLDGVRNMYWWTVLTLPNTTVSQLRELVITSDLIDKTDVISNTGESNMDHLTTLIRSHSIANFGAILWLILYPLSPAEATCCINNIIHKKSYFESVAPAKGQYVTTLLSIIVRHAALSWTVERVAIFVKYLSTFKPLSWLLYQVPEDSTMSLRCRLLMLTHGIEETSLARGIHPRTDVDILMRMFTTLSATLNWSKESQIQFASSTTQNVTQKRRDLGLRIVLEHWDFRRGCNQNVWNSALTLTNKLMGNDLDWFEMAEWIRLLTDTLSNGETGRLYRQITRKQHCSRQKMLLMKNYLEATWQNEGRDDRKNLFKLRRAAKRGIKETKCTNHEKNIF
jgi:hypothetical protein